MEILQMLVGELAKLEGRPTPAAGECPFCNKKPPFVFKDEVSKREHEITGLCQECQDQMYSGE